MPRLRTYETHPLKKVVGQIYDFLSCVCVCVCVFGRPLTFCREASPRDESSQVCVCVCVCVVFAHHMYPDTEVNFFFILHMVFT